MFGVLRNVYLPIIFDWVIETSIMASILVGLILCLKMLLKNQLTPRWQYALWLILLVRLMLPWSPNSSFSMYSMLLQGYEILSNPMQENIKMQTVKGFNEIKINSFNLKAESEGEEEKIFQDEGKGFGHLSIYELFMYVWLLGVLCLSSSIIIVNRRLHIYLHKQPVITNDRVLRIFESCKEQMSIERDISLLLAGKISSPALHGYVRPRILLYEKHVKQLDDKQLRFIFYHELAHFKRKDVGVNWLMYSLLLINWFNPILWYAYYAMREDQEIACDALALTFIGHKEKLAYGHTIITLLEHYSKCNLTPSLKNLSANKYALKRRVLMIKKFNKKSYRWSILGIATVLGVSIFSLMNAKIVESSFEKENIQKTNMPVKAFASQTKEAKEKEMNELKALQKKIDQYINEKQLSSSFQTKLTEKGLMVTILENVLFDSGNADVKLESLGIAKEMSNLLVSAAPREITVSGHTDNVPIANTKFASNWELSSQRAVNFIQVLLQNKELPAEKFSAIGYGDYRTINQNDTKEGKAKNRRVEVFILPLTEKTE
ncbi:M56 family metallopeptidase [Bacillus thuringiensis]|uniref:M56 family metallopeptidase n=1 Tax=Bacillus thuringiensis TaxID=1428 RepID=UPI000D564E58|nr:M56 family metallopeptidase [Bacillus thuringiensis]MBD8077304.1 OmpA family protein [Bacillus thuringiensis]